MTQYQFVVGVLVVCIVAALLIVAVMWLVGVALAIRNHRKGPDSFITQEMKRLESRGKK